MRWKLAASLVAIATLTMTAVGGLAASASSTSGRPAGTMRAKSEQLRFMSTKATSRRISVIVTGAFTVGGTDRPGRVIDVLKFPGGTLSYRHLSRTFSASLDVRTCLLTERETGRFTLGHGTGSFAGVHGSGKFALSIIAVTKKNRAGQCVHVQSPAIFQQLTTAGGTVTR